jgi:hypothetical protein
LRVGEGKVALIGAARGHRENDERPGIVTVLGRHLTIFAVSDAKPLILSEGEAVSGWRINSIAPLEVSLSGPTGNKTLRPQPDPKLAQSPGTVAAAAGVQPPAAPPGPLPP